MDGFLQGLDDFFEQKGTKEASLGRVDLVGWFLSGCRGTGLGGFLQAEQKGAKEAKSGLDGVGWGWIDLI